MNKIQNKFKPLKKNINKAKESVYFKAKFIYKKYHDLLPIEENTIIFQSYDGTTISGNPYYILKEICTNSAYSHIKPYVVSTWKNYNGNVDFLKEKGFENVTVLKIHSKEYCRVLAQAKYLVNNSTFAPYYYKKEGQIYLNTWHGTPLKNLGRKIHDAPHEIGNTQRNFLSADYLLYPNKFTFEHMRDDYMLTKFYTGQYVISGYPRNSIFFDKESADRIREELDIQDKQIVVYMPTWRGNLNNRKSDKQYVYMMHTLYEISNKLPKNMILYVKTHSLASSRINYSEFKNIKPFPNNYETYEFLNIADCLITDYSSVFFDFANTGKKIILYGYDKNEYVKDKGMYLNFEELPFSLVDNSQELLNELLDLKNYKNYDEFKNIYTRYDSINSAKEIADLLINSNKSENMEIIDGKKYHNSNPNIMIFGGNIAKNGITTALKGLINNVDVENYNYILTFYKGKVEQNKYTINDFHNIDYMPIQGQKNFTYFESLCQYLYFRWNIKGPIIKNVIKNIYEGEYLRLFPNIHFDYAIHFSGYEQHIIHLIKYMKDAKKIIYIHNDMKKEEQTKQNVNSKIYKKAIEEYDNVVCIRESSKKEILEFADKLDPDKVVIAHNINNIEEIKRKAALPLKFDYNTYCNISFEKLNEIVYDNTKEKFLNIGRYSPEKGQIRLIEAFLEYEKNNPNSYLIIVGGDGIAFKEIRNMVDNLESDKVILIKLLSNPYPILINSDLFILSSFYEGLPMTIMEALILDKTVISTNIPGPSEFLSRGYGHLVEDSKEGLLKGMCDFKKGEITTSKKFDAKTFNDNSIKEFNALLKK
ncbi:MAG: CDP-glycerol glycerophosphotransferase family protein [Eubacterium sp.]|nr:CDP-glycerol glycerophosphotransferase family protein [Eubacterium sp.]